MTKPEAARINGSKSRGPTTIQGKWHSCRNALRHGRRATKLAEFVPPESATLSKEDRNQYFHLFDQNLSKYRPNDPSEKGIVREITNAQWANLRIDRARQARLNLELQALSGDIHLAVEAAYQLKAMVTLRLEHAANARFIAQAERRLKLMKQTFPAEETARMTSAPDRTTIEPTQPVENTTEPENPNLQVIRLNGPLNRDVIAKYQKLFPGKDLSFIDEAPPTEVPAQNQAM